MDLKRALASPRSAHDPILREGDQLRIPINPMTVSVRGAVHVPSSVQYRSGASVDYYVGLCGGFRSEAMRREVIVLNPDGTATRRGWGWFGPDPLPGSVIIVPPYTGTLEEGSVAVTPPVAPGTVPPSAVQVPEPKEETPLRDLIPGTAPGKAVRPAPTAPTTSTVTIVQAVPAVTEAPSTTTIVRGSAPPNRMPAPLSGRPGAAPLPKGVRP